MAEETIPTTTETPIAEAPAAAVPDPAPAEAPAQAAATSTESLIARVEEEAAQAIEAIKESAAGLESKAADMEARIHQEVDVMWENLRANVSSVVPTTVHNFMHGEMEGLKARVSSLFHKEA